MSDSTEDKRKEGCSMGAAKVFLVLLGLAVVLSLIGKLGGDGPAAQVTRTPDQFSVFLTVRNSCGACGTDDPVGGWETEDGRMLILSSDRTFTADVGDGSTMRGDWAKAGASLCLLPVSGGKTCFDYAQKVDAMKLDNAIYIRR